MKFNIGIKEPRQLANVEAALKIIDPGAEIVDSDYDLRLIIEYNQDFLVRVLAPDWPAAEGAWEIRDRDILDDRYQKSDYPQRIKELIRLGVISLLGRRFNKKPAWGILSAVRPTKIFHHLRDRGFSAAEVRDKLLKIYALAPANVELLLEVGFKQEKYFRPPNYVGIYVGIPFCPSRCQYCSFPAVSLETHGHQVKGFLAALYSEIEATHQLLAEYGFLVESVYVGGGTPTSLDEADFADVLSAIKYNLFSRHTKEFTVEAGRPETVTPAKLQIMNNAGVTRICINPQSMNERTLERIGRRHKVAQVFSAVEMVKEFPGLSLNMDLILGLPGEHGTDFLESLQQVVRFAPDAVTIHTLAPKRAASWRKSFISLELTENTDIDRAWSEATAILRQKDFYPYYLYRQRSILADQANIGFARSGRENIYNIQMMEERQTILGLGGGAITKWVVGPDCHVFRLQNPKCPATYSSLIKDQIVKKAQQTRLLLG